VTYVFRFPATIEVAVHGSSGNEDAAFADAIAAVRKEIDGRPNIGARVVVAYMKGSVIDRQADEDPR